MPSRKLQHELKKQRPFDRPEQEAALGILRTSDQLQIHFARLFREYGLTPSQYNVLRILRGEGRPLPILEIASRTITVVPAITGLIDRLEAAELVNRLRGDRDRRIVHVGLTEKGAKTLAALDAPLLDLHQRLLGHLSATELTTLIGLLEKTRTGLTDL